MVIATTVLSVHVVLKTTNVLEIKQNSTERMTSAVRMLDSYPSLHWLPMALSNTAARRGENDAAADGIKIKTQPCVQ